MWFPDTPGPPAGKIVISRVTEEKCTVSWKIPLEDGGDSVTHYVIERRETSRLNWVIVEAECKTLSCVSSRLIKSNEYIFRVRGVNKFGPGVPLESEPVIARNAYSKYSASLQPDAPACDDLDRCPSPFQPPPPSPEPPRPQPWGRSTSSSNG